MRILGYFGVFSCIFLLNACGGGGNSLGADPASTNNVNSSSNSSSSGGQNSTPSSSGFVSSTPWATPEATATATAVATATPGAMATPGPTPVSSSEETSLPDQPSFFYFSYDDSGSTAARDLTLSSLSNGIRPQNAWGRPYEFLSAETFDHFANESHGAFDVSLGLYQASVNDIPINNELVEALQSNGYLNYYALGAVLSGPELLKSARPNIVLTLLIDVSGSMGSPYASERASGIYSLLDVVKHGLGHLAESLKEGDVVNIVTFSSFSQTLLEGAEFGSPQILQTIENLGTSGSTNLNSGITTAYDVALRTYDSVKANRVVILTDAYANQGEVDPSVIATNTTINSEEGIYFAGIGIGSGFNDAFLNELTDIGKSVYSAMVTPDDGERIFGEGFMRFVDHAVSDVRFRLDFPESFRHIVSSAEQVSTVAEEVQTINFSYNDSQFFFEMFASESEANLDDLFALELSYDDDGERVSYVVEKSVSELLDQGEDQILSGAMVSALAGLVSRELQCVDVLTSALYVAEVDTALFDEYKSYVEQYCSL